MVVQKRAMAGYAGYKCRALSMPGVIGAAGRRVKKGLLLVEQPDDFLHKSWSCLWVNSSW